MTITVKVILWLAYYGGPALCWMRKLSGKLNYVKAFGCSFIPTTPLSFPFSIFVVLFNGLVCLSGSFSIHEHDPVYALNAMLISLLFEAKLWSLWLSTKICDQGLKFLNLLFCFWKSFEAEFGMNRLMWLVLNFFFAENQDSLKMEAKRAMLIVINSLIVA